MNKIPQGAAGIAFSDQPRMQHFVRNGIRAFLEGSAEGIFPFCKKIFYAFKNNVPVLRKGKTARYLVLQRGLGKHTGSSMQNKKDG